MWCLRSETGRSVEGELVMAVGSLLDGACVFVWNDSGRFVPDRNFRYWNWESWRSIDCRTERYRKEGTGRRKHHVLVRGINRVRGIRVRFRGRI